MAKGEFSYHPATIGNGSNISGSVNIGYETIVGFIFPPSFESTSVTLKASHNPNGNYYDVYDSDGASVSIACAAERFVAVAPSLLTAVQNLKIVCGTATTAERVVTIVTRVVA